MHKSFVVVFMIMGIACNSVKDISRSDQENESEFSESNIQTSQDSFKLKGIYKGILPCASCPGIETTLILKQDFNYELKTKYLDKGNETYSYSGKYFWNKAKTKIVLAGLKNRPHQFLTAENYLIQLDMNGNRIKGELEQHYILRQQTE